MPDNLDEEAKKLFETLSEEAVLEMYEASTLTKAIKLLVEYLEKGFLSEDMTFSDVLEKLEKRRFELLQIDPSEAEDVEGEAG